MERPEPFAVVSPRVSTKDGLWKCSRSLPAMIRLTIHGTPEEIQRVPYRPCTVFPPARSLPPPFRGHVLPHIVEFFKLIRHLAGPFRSSAKSIRSATFALFNRPPAFKQGPITKPIWYALKFSISRLFFSISFRSPVFFVDPIFLRPYFTISRFSS